MHQGNYDGRNGAGQKVVYRAEKLLAAHTTSVDTKSDEPVIKIEAHFTRKTNIVFRKVTYHYEVKTEYVLGESVRRRVNTGKDVILEPFKDVDAAAAWAESEPTLKGSDFVKDMRANFAAAANDFVNAEPDVLQF